MTVLPGSEPSPFGPLQPLHEYILRSAHQLTFTNAHHILLYPILPLFAQSWLLQYPATRPYRLAVGVVAVYLSVDAWFHYRFYEPWLNAGNNLLGVAFLHFIGKGVEFALLEDPVPDPFAAKGRGIFMRSYDLVCNSRWIGLREIAVGSDLQPLKPDNKTRSQTEARWLKAPTTRRTRLQASLRHLRLAFIYGACFDTLLHLLQRFGHDTVGLSLVPPDGIHRFYTQPYILLPRSPFAFQAPLLLVDLVVTASIGGGVFTMLIFGYHLMAFLMVGSGVYEVEAWEVDLFHGPLTSDNLLEFWGKGWHQLFRHHFHLLTSLLMQLLHLPKSFLLPVVFSLSGFLHAIGQLSMSPAPTPSSLFLFFFYQGLGCTAEIAFKRYTGKNVAGWSGWMWRNAFLAITAQETVRAELQSGLGGTSFFPWNTGPGYYAVGLITRYIVDTA